MIDVVLYWLVVLAAAGVIALVLVRGSRGPDIDVEDYWQRFKDWGRRDLVTEKLLEGPVIDWDTDEITASLEDFVTEASTADIFVVGDDQVIIWPSPEENPDRYTHDIIDDKEGNDPA